MKLEEAHKYIVDDNEMVLERPDYFVVEEKYEDIYATLFFDITDLVSGDESVVENIKNNPLVKSFKDKGDCYYIDTTFGKGIFFAAHDIFGKEGTNQIIKPNNCHTNSIITSLLIKSMDLGDSPSVLTGITTFSIGKPVLHSVCSVGTGNGRVIVDYTYDLVMSEELFLKLYNFKVLNETNTENLINLMNLDRKYRKHMIKTTGIDEGCGCTGVYFLLANEDSLNYMNDVIRRKREDDFPFLTEEDFQRKMDKLRKEANEISESKKR